MSEDMIVETSATAAVDNISNSLLDTDNHSNINNSEDSDDESKPNDLNLEDLLGSSYLKISGYSNKILRAIKLEIEEFILKKLKKLEDIDQSKSPKVERCVYYLKDFSIDKIGNQVIVGETGIAEGWKVPIYQNEYPNLLGLPFTEDYALAETLRNKRPRQECFNCLATNHRVTECPIRINDERIAIHRNLFNSQSMQSQELSNGQMNRYTSDPDSKQYRGLIPGKISDQLREALGCKPNQLPPFIYLMREIGYPIGWLLEAQVNNKNKLAVLNGDALDKKGDQEDILIDDQANKTETDPVEIEYDATKIYSFIGFNEQPSSDYIDESDKYTYGPDFKRVRKYGPELSKEKFLSTLKLEKKKVVNRRSMFEIKNESTTQFENASIDNNDETDNINKDETKSSLDESDDAQKNEACSQSLLSPVKDQKVKIEHGASLNEILGTPIVNNVKGITNVPDWEKFSENICEHKPYEMNSQTPTGSYKNIVRLTREYKSSPQFNNN